MNTVQQMLHLWRKDWRRTWWLFLALCVSVVLSTVVTFPAFRAATCEVNYGCHENVSGLLQLLCGFVALVFVASVVQDDSPVDSSAFWRAQPVTPNALLYAKFLYACVTVLLIAIAAQVASMAANLIPIIGALNFVGITLYWAASLVLLGMLLSAIMPGTQSLLLAAAGLVLVRTMESSGILVYVMGNSATPWVQTGFRADVWTAGCASLIAWAYLGRNYRPKIRTGLLALGTLVLTIAWDSGQARGVRFLTLPIESSNPSLPAITTSIAERDSNFVFRLQTASAPSGHRYALTCATLMLHFVEGDYTSPWTSLCGVGRVTPPTFRPDVDNADVTPGVATHTFIIAKKQQPYGRMTALSTSMQFDGFLEDQRLEEVVTLPVENGAVVVKNGVRFEIVTIDTVVAGSTAKLVFLDVLEAQVPVIFGRDDDTDLRRMKSSPWMGRDAVPFTENAFELRIRNGHDTSAPLPEWPAVALYWSTTSLALPAPNASRSHPPVNPGCLPTCSPEWWRNKSLVVSRWKHVSYAPVHVDLLRRTR